jgi:uncharacterized protein YndB with AHSA1/START domain
MTTPTAPLTLTLERRLEAPPERLFRAWTDPGELARWFAPDPEFAIEVEVDLKVGGAYRVAMGPHVVRGVYREVDPPRRLVFTWRWDTAASSPEMLVTVTFEAIDPSGTQLVLQHDLLPSEDERTMHDQGWRAILERLEGLLATD